MVSTGDLSYIVNRLLDSLVNSKMDDLIVLWNTGKPTNSTRPMVGLTHVCKLWECLGKYIVWKWILVDLAYKDAQLITPVNV